MNKKLVATFVALFFLVGVVALALAETTPAPTAPVAGSATKLKTGDKTVCPVDNKALTVKKTTPEFQYEGKYYYFCNQKDMTAFKKEPTKYIAAAPAPTPAPVPPPAVK